MNDEEYESMKKELYDLQIQIELLDHRQRTLVKRLDEEHEKNRGQP